MYATVSDMALRTQSGQLLEQVRQAASVTTGPLLTPNSERSGLQVTADKDITYLKLYAGVDGSAANAPAVTVANYDIFLPAGGSWPGTVGGVVWTGGVACISLAATGNVVAIGT